MEIIELTERDWLRVEEYENVGAQASSVAFGRGDAYVRLLRLDTSGWVEPHEAGFGQLFVPIEGTGWVSEGSQRAAIRVGQAAYFSRGVIRAKSSDTGMIALLIQVDDLDLGGTP